jgi:hypothetical protein
MSSSYGVERAGKLDLTGGQQGAPQEHEQPLTTTVPETSRIDRGAISKISSLEPSSLTIEQFMEVRSSGGGILPQLLLLEV